MIGYGEILIEARKNNFQMRNFESLNLVFVDVVIEFSGDAQGIPDQGSSR
jgi:hypothetical protein